MPAIALPAALPAFTAGSNLYQPGPTPTVNVPNVPVIDVRAPSPTTAPDLHKRGGHTMDPCRPMCGGWYAGDRCVVPLSDQQKQWLKCDISYGLVWTSLSFDYGGTTTATKVMTREPAPGYEDYLRTRTSAPTALPTPKSCYVM